jgi:hypothetical protein
MGEWVAREYLARRGSARFSREQLIEHKCPLLGYLPKQVRIEGAIIPTIFMQVENQLQGGPEVVEEGARQWRAFFHRELQPYLTADLDPLGRKIVEACLNDATQEDYWKLIPHVMFKEF